MYLLTKLACPACCLHCMAMQVVEKEVTIQEKEKKCLELKKTLARQPGPHVAEQLNEYQGVIREKNRQMKAMAGELNMNQAQVRMCYGSNDIRFM